MPLNAEAVLLIRKQIGKHATYVFSFRGRPITQVSTKAWYEALARAGIEEFRWHDLRHTWASWHVQAGTPLHVLQELEGLGVRGDGAEVCAPVERASGRIRGSHVRLEAGEGRGRGYDFVTVAPIKKGCISATL